MSLRLNTLQATIGTKKKLTTDEARLRWLNRGSFVSDGMFKRAEWAHLLNRLARRAAADRSIALADAWFQVAFALAASVPDPKDYLYGIAIAVTADNAGLCYDDVETYLRLIAGYRAMYAEHWMENEEKADELAYFFDCRLMDIETALKEPLDNDTSVSPDMLADPDVVVAGSLLLSDAIDDHAAEHAQAGAAEMDDEEVESFIDYGGHYLWACYHARRHGVAQDELTRFVCLYTDEWFVLMDALVSRDLLNAGVLDALVEHNGSYGETVEQGVDLVAAYRAAHTDMTLVEYLNACLAPAAQNA